MQKIDESSYDTVVFEELQKCLKDLAYGEVIVTVHDSRVVQIEKREKKRFSEKKHGDCTGRAQKD